jgi:hypothetical protein
VDGERCAACGTEFRGRSRPTWAFDRETGVPRGRVHASCTHVLAFRVMHGCTGYEQDYAQFWGWTRYWRTSDETIPIDVLLVLDGLGPDLSDAADRRLTHWVRGPREMSVRQVVEIVDARRQLITEFRAWQRRLPSRAP